MNTLLLGTRNPGKVIEIVSILADSAWSFSSLQEFPNVGEAEENFTTFAENAIAKAQFYASATGLCALADDSGLEVEALGGAPGVFSARYAGANGTDSDRRTLLLTELGKSGDTTRCARFVAVVAISKPSGEIINLSEGICNGTLTFEPRGTVAFATVRSHSSPVVPAALATTTSSFPPAPLHSLPPVHFYPNLTTPNTTLRMPQPSGRSTAW